MKIAFFDLDHTLLPIDSGDKWTRELVSHAGDDRQALEAEAERFHQGYLAGDFDIDECVAFQLGLLARYPREKLDAWRDAFVRDVVAPIVPARSVALVRASEAMGFHPVLATGTHAYIAEAVAPLFGIEDVIAACPEVDASGAFTGGIVGSHSYQDGKLRLARAYVEEKEASGVKVEALQAYSDSINDVSLLRYAASRGEAFAVNPDKALERVALEEHWPVIELFAKDSN